MKLTTEDCQKYLVEKHADDIAAMFNDPDYENDEGTMLWIKNAKNPKKWKRMTKYNVGSDIDKGETPCAPGGYAGRGYHEHPQFAGGIVRTFYLEGTDHVTYNLIEVDGQIVGEEDCSD